MFSKIVIILPAAPKPIERSEIEADDHFASFFELIEPGKPYKPLSNAEFSNDVPKQRQYCRLSGPGRKHGYLVLSINIFATIFRTFRTDEKENSYFIVHFHINP